MRYGKARPKHDITLPVDAGLKREGESKGKKEFLRKKGI
jgi:hypothetical protein